MKLFKRVLVPVLCVLVLAAAASAAKMTKEEARNYYRNLASTAGATPAANMRSIFRSKAPQGAPSTISTDPQYGATQLLAGLTAPSGIGVGTLGDYVLINDYAFGDLFGYRDGVLKYLGSPSFSLAAGRNWGHYYFGDEAGNLFRLETDRTITPVMTYFDEPGLEIGSLAIDHTTGDIYIALNIYLAGYPIVDFWKFNPSTEGIEYIGELTDEFCFGIAVKGNYLYFSLVIEDVIIKWNWKKNGPLILFTDKVSGPFDILFDTAGNLFVVENNIGDIVRFNASGTSRKKIAWGINGPECLGLDRAGDVFFDDNAGEVWKLRKKY